MDSEPPWKSKVQAYSSETERNLRQVQRAGVAGSTYRHNQDYGEQLVGMGGLLAAVQGSLADLRIEVAAAKRLSNNANAALNDPTGRVQRPSSAPRHHPGTGLSGLPRETPPPRRDLFTPRVHSFQPRDVYANGQTSLGGQSVASYAPQGYSPRHITMAGLYAADGAPEASANGSTVGGGSGVVYPDDLMRVMDNKMDEMGRRLEQHIERSLHTTGPSEAGASPTRRDTSSDPLLLLGVSRAEAAEKGTIQLTHQLSTLERHHGKTLEELSKRVSELQDSNKQHWERMCSVVSQVEAIQMHYKQSVDALPAAEHLSRLDHRLSATEAAQARGTSELEEQQRLLLALTTAVQKAGQEADTARAGRARQDELSKQIETVVQRIVEVEARVSSLNSTLLANKTRELTIGVNGVQAMQPSELLDRMQAMEERLQVMMTKDTAVKDQRITTLESRLESLEQGLADVTRGTEQALSTKVQVLDQTISSRLHALDVKVTPLQDIMSRVDQAELQLTTLQASSRDLTKQFHDVRTGSTEITAQLGSVGAQLEALMSATGRVDIKADPSRLSALEGRVNDAGGYIDTTVKPGLSTLQDQVQQLTEHVHKLERAQAEAVTKATVAAEAASKAASMVQAVGGADRGLVRDDVVGRLGELEAQVGQLATQMTKLQHEVQVLKESSAEELDRSQRIMAAAEAGLVATRQSVVQAMQPLRDLQGRVEALRDQLSTTQKQAEQAASQASAAAEALAALDVLQEQQEELQERLQALQLGGAAVGGAAATAGLERTMPPQQQQQQLGQVEEQVQRLQGRLDADWFVVLEQDQLDGAPLTHLVHEHSSMLTQLEERLQEELVAVRTDLGNALDTVATQAEQVAAQAAAVGEGEGREGGVQEEEFEQLRAMVEEQGYTLQAVEEKLEGVAVKVEQQGVQVQKDSEALMALTATVGDLQTGSGARTAAHVAAGAGGGLLAASVARAIAAPSTETVSMARAIAAPSTEGSITGVPVPQSSPVKGITLPTASTTPSKIPTPTLKPSSTTTATAPTTTIPTAKSVPHPSPLGTRPSTTGPSDPMSTSTTLNALPSASVEVEDMSDFDEEEPLDPLSNTLDTLDVFVAEKNDTVSSLPSAPAGVAYPARPLAALQLLRNESISNIDGLTPPPRARGAQPLPSPEKAVVESSPFAVLRSSADGRGLASPLTPPEDASVHDKAMYYESLVSKRSSGHSGMSGPITPAKALTTAGSGDSDKHVPSAAASLPSDQLQKVEAMLHTCQPVPTAMDHSPSSLDSPDTTGAPRPQPVLPLTTPHRPRGPHAISEDGRSDASSAIEHDLATSMAPRQLETLLDDMSASTSAPPPTSTPATMQHTTRQPVVTSASPSQNLSTLSNLPPLKGMGGAAAPAPAAAVTSPPGAKGEHVFEQHGTRAGTSLAPGIPARDRFKRSSSGTGKRPSQADSQPSIETDIQTDDDLGDVVVDDELDELPMEYLSGHNTAGDSRELGISGHLPDMNDSRQGEDLSLSLGPGKGASRTPPPTGSRTANASSLGMSSDSSDDIAELSMEAGRIAELLNTPPTSATAASAATATPGGHSMPFASTGLTPVKTPYTAGASVPDSPGQTGQRHSTPGSGGGGGGVDVVTGTGVARELYHSGSKEFLALDSEEEEEGEIGMDEDGESITDVMAPSPMGPRDSPGPGVGTQSAGGVMMTTVTGGVDERVRGTLELFGADEEEEEEESEDGDRSMGGASDLSSAPSAHVLYATDRESAGGAGVGVTAAGMSRNPLAVRATADEVVSDDDEVEVFGRPSGALAGAGLRPAGAVQAPVPAAACRAPGPGTYVLSITTGTKTGAGIKETLHVTLRGSAGSGSVVVENPGPLGMRLQRGETDVVELEADGELGQIQELHVWHTGQGFSESWNVERVHVHHPISGTDTDFVLNDWVRGGRMSGRAYKPGVRVPGPLSRESSAGSLDTPMMPSIGIPSPAGTGGGGIGRSGTPPSQPVPAINKPVGGRAGVGDESMSLDFDSEEELPMFGGASSVGGGGSAGESISGRLGLPAGLAPLKMADPASASAPQPVKGLAHQPPGVLLDEDVEDVSLSTGLTWSSNPLAADTPGGGGMAQGGSRGCVVAPTQATTPKGGRPPLPPLTGAGVAAPVATSRGGARSGGGTQLTAAALGFSDSSQEGSNGGLTRSNSDLSLPDTSFYVPSAGLGSGRKSGRMVRTSAGQDDDLSRASADSWDSQDNGMVVESSQQSLTGIAPGGVRPPFTQGTTIGYLGTSHGGKRVSFSEYSEQFDIPALESEGDDDDTHSGVSLDEDEVQTRRGPRDDLTYDQLLELQSQGQDRSHLSPNGHSNRHALHRTTSSGQEVLAPRSPGGGGAFEDVPLGHRKGRGKSNVAVSAMAYRIKMFTADRMNAGLGSTAVHLEILGSTWVISQALPKAKGSFQRGCVDRFAVAAQSGELGDVLAIKVWHESSVGAGVGPAGKLVASLSEGKWCLHQIQIENKMRGVRYVFTNTERGGWLPAGRRHAVVLKPQVERLDELEDLRLVQMQVQAQLQACAAPDERKTLSTRLSKVGEMITSLAKGKRNSK